MNNTPLGRSCTQFCQKEVENVTFEKTSIRKIDNAQHTLGGNIYVLVFPMFDPCFCVFLSFIHGEATPFSLCPVYYKM